MKTIYSKLASAKGEIGAISKDSKNPFFKSKYFDINQLLHHVEPLLLKNGLVVLQPIINNCVVSQIIDIDNGEKVESELKLPELTDPQKIGACISYYRRYSLSSLLSLQAEDEDGNNLKPKPAPVKIKLTEEGYLHLCTKGTKDNILTALKDRIVTIDQKNGLEELLKTKKD